MTTTAADLKKQLAEISNQRSRLEADVRLARARLEATNLGMDEPLVDNEVRKSNCMRLLLDLGSLLS